MGILDALGSASQKLHLELFVTPNTEGLDAELASKLTAVERTAEASAQRVANQTRQIAESTVASTGKVREAQLRAAAATEHYNSALQSERTTSEQLYRAQASQLSAQRRLTTEQQKSAEAAALQERHVTRIGVGGVASLLGATYVAERLFRGLEHGAEASAALERAQTQSGVAIANSGRDATTATEDFRQLAQETANLGVSTDTSALSAENLLATYSAIGDTGPASFARVFRVARDMAVAVANTKGGVVDLTGSTRSLGLALQNPETGLDRLRRAGLAFTQSERERIKTLAESNRVTQAQALILDLVEQKVGGSAEAFGTTAEGGFNKAKIAEEEFSRSLSESFLPVVTDLLDKGASALSFFTEHDAIRRAAIDIGALTVVLVASAKAYEVLKNVKRSELIADLARLTGYRSIARAEVQASAQAIRHSESVNIDTAAVERNTTALEVNAAAATRNAETNAAVTTSRGASAATSTAGAAVTGATVGRFAGTRAVAAGAARTLGVIGLADLLAEATGFGFTGAFHMGKSEGLREELTTAYNRLNTQGGRGRRTLGAVGSGGLRDEALTALSGDPKSLDTVHALAKAISDMNVAYDKNIGVIERRRTVIDEATTGEDTFIRATNLHTRALAQQTAEAKVAAEQDLKGAIAADKSANARLRAARHVKASDFDKIVAGIDLTAAPADTSSLQNTAVSSARSADSARARVTAAEQRLADVRENSKTTAAQLAAAESALASAKNSAANADDRASASQKKLDDARNTGLSFNKVLDRFRTNSSKEQALATDTRKLVAKGIHEPVLEQLQKLEADAPGTMDKVAESIDKAGAHELNRQYRLANAARDSIKHAFADSVLEPAQRAAERAAHNEAETYKKALALGIDDPVWRRRIHGLVAEAFPGRFGSSEHGPTPRSGGRTSSDNNGFTGPVHSLSGQPTTSLSGHPLTSINVQGDLVVNDGKHIVSEANRRARLGRLSGSGGVQPAVSGRAV